MPYPLFQKRIASLYKEPTHALMKKMRKKGAVMLSGFMQEAFYKENVGSITSCHFEDTGPLHLRYYQTCQKPSGFLLELKQFFMSNELRKWIQKLVGLEMKSVEYFEIRRFLKGQHYTLLHDSVDENEKAEEDCLEACFCMPIFDKGVEEETLEWDFEFGAWASYIDSADGSELLSVYPMSNSLLLTLKESGVQDFVKFVSSYSPADRYDILLRYKVGDVADEVEFSSSSEDIDSDDDDDDRHVMVQGAEAETKKRKTSEK